MLDITKLSDARRTLLEKYLRGNLPQSATPGQIIPRRTAAGYAPLSFGQQQLWLLAQLTPNTPVYNECVTIHMPGSLDVPALEQGLNEFIRRHEIWRTSFPVVDGLPVQVVHPSLKLTLPVVDLRHLPEAEREAEALRVVTEKARVLFDLSAVPLLRPTLVHFNDEEHRLFLTLHHIIFDGVAIYQVFLPELRTLYEAFSSGQPSPLPELPIQYGDYAQWQRERLQGDVFAEQLAYLKHQLADAPTTLELPTDHPRPPVQTHRGSMRPFGLSRRLTDELKALSRQQGVTLYMTLVAAFKTLLYRYTEQEDMLVGTATAGRKHSEMLGMMGFFLNTLVLRTDLSGNPTFRALQQRVREVILEALAHQDIPFEYLVKELQPERNLGQNPLFQALITLEPPLPVLPSGWTLTQMDVRVGTSKFDLYLELDDRPEGLIGRFMYNTDLFDASTIERITGHWQTLLEAIVRDPNQRIADLPLLREQEQEQLLVGWNATNTAFPENKPVHQIFEEQAQRRPEAVALVFDEQTMTYGELNRRANQLAHRLRRLGVVEGAETRVGLCMDRSLEMVVSLPGILKAGGAYVPLDPSYPRERLAFMLQDTQAPVLLTQAKLLDLLPGDEDAINRVPTVICLDGQDTGIEQEPIENLPQSATQAKNLAYVMYTSGSTGRPKGVEIRHFSITRLLFGIDYAHLDETQTVLHMAPISFDASTFEVWGALLHGGRCILYPERVPTPKSMGALIRKHAVTTLWLTASLFNTMIDEAPEELRGVKQLLTGGEALSVTHIRRALRQLPGTRLINGYGPTETTTFACCYPIPADLSETLRSIPIGRPIGNTQVYVLNRQLKPVPVGVPGELYIGGAGVARGYLNRPELTAEKFIPDPFSDRPDARLYKTGDLVRYLLDGTIEFLGRRDQQVKMRGFRIEPGEIETVLGQYSALREALVLVHENERGEKSLVAYVVPGQGQHVTMAQMRQHLKVHLPEYMIPADFIVLESLPLTPNGKLDRQALPTPESARRTVGENYVAPKLMIHHQLIAIWEELLNRQPIGITDNFFHVGGHSLLAARLVGRIEQIFGKKIALSTLFAGPTIEQLAQAIQQRIDADEGSSRAAIIAVQMGKAGQRPFFYLHGDYMGGAFYCFTLARGLGAEQPFYALEPYKFNGLRIPPTIKEIAAAHIEALRAIQPKGPYLLGGFCNGGLMAYEMARQLRAAGESLDMLLLIDPASPPHSRTRRAYTRICDMFGVGEDTQIDWQLRLRHIYKYLRFPLYRKGQQDTEGVETAQTTKDVANAKGHRLPRLRKLFPDPEMLRQDWPGVYRWEASGYRPGTYDGKITFVWSSEDKFRKAWIRTMPPVQVDKVFVIPGSHLIYTLEQVNALAQRLRACLDVANKGQ